MNDEQKRIAIAIACGWKNINRSGTIVSWCFKFMAIVGFNPKAGCTEQIPDYLNSLDAMHEAEEHLGDDFTTWLTYEKFLAESDTKFIWHATARQRAEAFILTLNLPTPCEPS